MDGAAITGMGAVSAIGLDIASMRDSLREGRGGIGRIAAFSTEGLSVHHAGEIADWPAESYFGEAARTLDRTAQLAIVAARQAVAESGLSRERLASGRVALVLGICAGGIGAPDGPGLMAIAPDGDERAECERLRAASAYAQTDAVAADLGIAGPRLTVATACAASTSALAVALALLRAGRADEVVVGGADAWARGTYAGFYALGAMATQPCSPFSRDIGVTFGEGAGCLVIERAPSARRRGASVHATLLACGGTSDAHHITSPNPSGQGLLRAMRLALAEAGLEPAAIDYVNAHGTGTSDNDAAETVAIHRLFEATTPPPVSSSKSFFGHTMGGAGILEFIASLLGMQGDFAPPTINFIEARPGCDLDCVPNVARPMRIDAFMSLSAAFGGINAVAIGTRARAEEAAEPAAQPPAEIVVTGFGVVSPIGHGAAAFRAALQEGSAGIAPLARFPAEDLSCRSAALIGTLPLRQLAPAADLRRADLITRYAVCAATLALKDAGLAGRVAPERIGLFVAMSAGPAGSAQLFAEALRQDGEAGLGARLFPPIVLATVSGQVGQACQIRGASFTLMDGAGAGLQALALAHDMLRQHDELDAIVVLAADEVASVNTRVLDRLGLLGTASPFAADGAGFVPGEGAVALVIERAPDAQARGATPYGRIAGVALRGEASGNATLDATGSALATAAQDALAEAGGAPDLIYGLARGATAHDGREAAALRTVLGDAAIPVGSLNGQLGLAEATSGLYAAAAALLGLRHGEAYAIHGLPPATALHPDAAGLDLLRAPRRGSFRRVLALGSSEHGNGAAVVFAGA